MAEDTSIWQEIDESLRVEKFQQFWKRFSVPIMIVCAGIVIAAGGRAFWKSHMDEVHAQQTDGLAQAQALAKEGKHAEAAAAFGKASEADTHSLSVIAKLHQAHELMLAGQPEKARAVYAGVAVDNAAEPGMRDFAVLQVSADPQTQSARDGLLQASAEGRPYHAIAQEIEATRALDKDKASDAKKLLEHLAGDANTPPGVRAQATELLDAQPADAQGAPKK